MTDSADQTDGGRRGGSEGESQESDLAALVRQYEKETGDQSDGKDSKVLKSLQPVVDFARRQMSKDEQAEADASIDGAYKFVTEETTLKSMSKPLVRGFLEAYALENPKFAEAFSNQRKDPAAWKKELAEGRDWVKGQYEELLKDKTDIRKDLEAAKAAVAGTSTDEGEGEKLNAAKLFEMSDSDFNKTVREEIAKSSSA